ncbi:Txe/YoeB family addiction module toxin [Enterococcus faecium]|uniref:Txe/YoeB family addiction module toxin n=1 Tax=Enterococcus faecium TaxID=1352 RepID=UPI000CF28E71|nr:Txe/YoeB family addiction module toxin [Enterococcus faecium]EME7174873.1 Txe/YoeB family addiction module toxin [Enterococcus faecium]MDQ8244770.1 Txe/YoeB family addiction module toxin [Enterococcus faecium]MDQ8301497.1 Txe/YoeB family addiction module toxin [Enterococcus faecium]MDQ8428145.1 Txe/YoeB family addiction module toxin [Enterococcus faecium]MDQ8571188.1 Txe/YoeB family addiction module toxin [Enterococcus faecium]
MGFTIEIKKNAKKDLPKLKAVGLHKKFDELIQVIRENPFQTPPPYEKLVGVPYYSRRINIQHRLVYSVDIKENVVVILSVWSHYERGLN